MNDVDCCRHSKLLGIEFLESENDLCQRRQCGLLVDVLLIVVISERLRDGEMGEKEWWGAKQDTHNYIV